MGTAHCSLYDDVDVDDDDTTKTMMRMLIMMMCVYVRGGTWSYTQVSAVWYNGAHGDGRQHQHCSVDRQQVRHHQSNRRQPCTWRTRAQQTNTRHSRRTGHHDSLSFYRAMLCISAACTVVPCPSVRLSRLCILSKRMDVSSIFFTVG